MDYLKKMLENGTWVDFVFLYAAARDSQTNLCITNLHNGNETLLTPHPDQNSHYRPTLELGLVPKHHLVSLRPGKGKENPILFQARAVINILLFSAYADLWPKRAACGPLI